MQSSASTSQLQSSPSSQTDESVQSKSAGCLTCHTQTDASTMHLNPAVKLGCTDCHGGNSSIRLASGAQRGSDAYGKAFESAHVLPRYPKSWHYPSSANPERTYTLLNRESPEFVRFINPSDYRVAKEACGACHMEVIEASVRSLHSTGAMLWGGAAYNNGILDFKQYILGEAYDRDGNAIVLKGPKIPDNLIDARRDRRHPAAALSAADLGVAQARRHLPRVRARRTQHREPVPRDRPAEFQRSAAANRRAGPAGLPPIQSRPGTGARISVPVINITKTRLNDPFTWFIGTNDQPGDYRHSGCASCHVVYANERDPRHSSIYGEVRHDGRTQTVDPTISKTESGHPLTHTLTRSVPTSQCMICHMHQPNMFLNSFLGYTMWDYESDAPRMWPQKQQYPTSGADPRRAGSRIRSSRRARQVGRRRLPQAGRRPQSADEGHAVRRLSRSRLELPRGVQARSQGQPARRGGQRRERRRSAEVQEGVHLSSIHVDVGMQCVDCHFSQDNHGNGYIYGEVAPRSRSTARTATARRRSAEPLHVRPAALGGGTT
jgi:hypothetical protein